MIYDLRYSFLQVQVKNSGCERFSAENENANLAKSDMNESIGIALRLDIFHKNGLNVIL